MNGQTHIKNKQFSFINTSSKKQLRSVNVTSKDGGEINYKDIFFEFMTEIILARIKCQCFFCEHGIETSGM